MDVDGRNADLSLWGGQCESSKKAVTLSPLGGQRAASRNRHSAIVRRTEYDVTKPSMWYREEESVWHNQTVILSL